MLRSPDTCSIHCNKSKPKWRRIRRAVDKTNSNDETGQPRLQLSQPNKPILVATKGTKSIFLHYHRSSGLLHKVQNQANCTSQVSKLFKLPHARLQVVLKVVLIFINKKIGKHLITFLNHE